MDGFIDRLADLIRSLGGSGPSRSAGPSRRDAGFIDPDLRDAWQELDEYMRTGRNEEKPHTERTGSQRAQSRRPGPDESLRQDYANLEVPFGADMPTVRKAYKRLVLKYHPDRFAADPEKQKIALEITKKINESFERVRDRKGE